MKREDVAALAGWRRKLEDKTLSIGDLEQLLLDWGNQIEELQSKIDEFEEAPKPETVDWGTCRRGCPPAYLNAEGYCSPNCERGWPRGEFVVAPSMLITNADGGWIPENE